MRRRFLAPLSSKMTQRSWSYYWLSVVVRPSGVRCPSVNNCTFDFFFRTVTQIAFKFNIQVPRVVLSQICSFCAKISYSLFLVNILCHFWSKLIFSTSSSKPQVRMLPNLIYKYLGWFFLRFVHFVSKSQILYFWRIFLSFLVKINIFNFFKTASQNVFKFDLGRFTHLFIIHQRFKIYIFNYISKVLIKLVHFRIQRSYISR